MGALAANGDTAIGGGIDGEAVDGVPEGGLMDVVVGIEGGEGFNAAETGVAGDQEGVDLPCAGIGGGGGVAEDDLNLAADMAVEVHRT